MKYVVLLVFVGVFSLISLQFFFQNHHISMPVITHIQTTKTLPLKLITILLGGDVMLGRSVTVQALDVKHDSRFPFLGITSLMDTSDLVFVNLETPITTDCPRQTEGMVFCAPPQMLDGLIPDKTIVNLANNHTANHGVAGFTQTEGFLTDKHIAFTGVSELTTKTIQGTTFGFLGFDKDQQSNPVLTQNERLLITESKQKVDVLVVALHWGIEYQSHPTEGQRKLAQELSSLGVNVVAGHHPHWVQDVDQIRETPIYYSLGNLIFDQTWSEETRHGLLVKLTFNGKKLEQQELIPTYIKEIGQPIIMPSPKE